MPTILNWSITENCNSRCVMCDLWKTHSNNELDVSEWNEIFSNKLFSEIRYVGISGGEPTLRKDLVQLVDIALKNFPQLIKLTITTHGFHPYRWKKIACEIKQLITGHDIDISINISMDGVRQVHDDVRRIPNGFRKILETVDILRSKKLDIQVQSTLISQNVFHICKLDKFLDTNKLNNSIFRLGVEIPRLNNNESIKAVHLDANENSFIADYIQHRLLNTKIRSPARKLFYQDVHYRLVNDTVRRAPCFFQNEGILLTSLGDMYHCSISKEKIGNVLEESAINLYFSSLSKKTRNHILNEDCVNCFHDQSGAWSPWNLFYGTLIGSSLYKFMCNSKKLFLLFKNLLLALLLSSPLKKIWEKKDLDNSFNKNNAVVIGAYGGEHVGDAAILGGVCLRINKVYGVTDFSILSFRPHRTERWIRELQIPFNFEVVNYSFNKTKAKLKESSVLVYGGGPIMDLPFHLSKHLLTALTAKLYRLPFVIEGCGIGPLNSRVCKVLAKRISLLADTISIRTQSSANNDILSASNVEVTQDPAFDYLSTRKKFKLSEKEERIYNDILKHRKQRLAVINLRPLWQKYVSSYKKVKTKDLGDQFNYEFSNSIQSISESYDHDISFIFFPMNADQLGFSDLTIAYQIEDLLTKQVDFRILEYEPGIDFLIQLIRNADFSVMMRFHAAIFSISQDIPTIGIGYSVGYAGKVEELFFDLGLHNRFIKITDFSTSWILKQIRVLEIS